MNEDLDGYIWVGTTSGPVIYPSPSDVFENSDVSANQVAIRRNDGTDVIDFLLSGETIYEIKTDGGNRKWIATDKSGVFLVSWDGQKTIYNFREENSPLLSNNISGIGIMEKTGEVFFATDKGLISYKAVATKGNENFQNVYVYPNPVREDFDGNITVTGLMEKTIVKITDINGNLVFETTSLGGQASWNGNNFNGNRVGTGVYLVFLSTQDGSQSHITKILFIH
jgi:ligand-binding sensor domain-containing protein